MPSARAQGQDPHETLDQFIAQAPAAKYIFDSERGSDQSEICRETNGQKECKEVKLASKQMFEAMQKNGFFCALPMDPGRTHMECTPMPK